MNLNEAAETMRRYYDPKDQFDGPCGSAPDVLQMAMLAELDPTPISEEWLESNGWVLAFNAWCYGPHDLMRWNKDEWRFFKHPTRIKTLGELRTLLRLMGEGGK